MKNIIALLLLCMVLVLVYKKPSQPRKRTTTLEMSEITERVKALPDETIEKVRADIDEWRKRYEYNVRQQEHILFTFRSVYSMNSSPEAWAAREILIENAAKGDMFALANYSFRAQGEGRAKREQYLLEAVEAGELEAMTDYGWDVIGSGYYRGPKAEEGLTYLRKASAAGGSRAKSYICLFYARYKPDDIENLCAAAADAYKSYSFEPFLRFTKEDRHVIQNTCQTFSNKQYTVEGLVDDWVFDVDTDDARYLQAKKISRRDPEQGKKLLEELAQSENINISANSLASLGLMYYREYEKGGADKRELAYKYVEQALEKGNTCAYRLVKKERKLPPGLLITDYAGCF